LKLPEVVTVVLDDDQVQGIAIDLPGHCWLCRDQLEVLSKMIRIFGLAAVPALAPTNMSISSAPD
jgi:hypothetical protein